MQTQPLLQRLLGERQQTWDDYLSIIKQDVEGLLNTFTSPLQWPHGYQELTHSLLQYGMPNYLAQGYQFFPQRQKLCQHIGNLLLQNEPRLSNVQVNMQEEESRLDLSTLDCQFHIRIEAHVKWQTQIKNILLESAWNPKNMSFILR